MKNVLHAASEHTSGSLSSCIRGNIESGLKLLYSGYTRRCKAMVEDWIGPTIFIHDETFDDSLHVGVIMNNHSTTKKTAQVAKSYRVYRVILTHFSQCNPKISIFSDNYTSQACIAFIMMSVNLVDLLLVPSLIHFSRWNVTGCYIEIVAWNKSNLGLTRIEGY